jgi:hypothetical protein
MTKKIAVSLPDDIAEQLKGKPNVSAYVAEALRRRLDGDEIRRRLAAVGRPITDEQVADARAEYDEMMASARANPELQAAAAKLYAEVTAARARSVR